jgi:hypothetical protein
MATGNESPTKGAAIIRASWIGTAALAVTSIPAAVLERWPGPAVAVDLGLFLAGAIVFLWAYGIAVGRSREHEIGIGGLYFLQGTAPKPARNQLLGSLAAQTVIAIGTAAARPFTALAFGILVPVWGLALCGLWGARYGRFGPRVPAERRR